MSTEGRARKTALLIEKNVVRPMEPVYYGSKKMGRMAEGRMTSTGIICNCCGITLTLTDFEAHAGSRNRRPSKYIFLEDGRSISDCLEQLKATTSGSTELVKKDDEGKQSFMLFGTVIQK